MLLALDTSGPFCAAALFADGATVACRSENLGRGHAERLMPMLIEILEQERVDWTAIKRIACVNGPGSFTGLRVGLAAAKGLSLALNVPCCGVSVFEAFAHRYGPGKPLGVVMDAKRNQVWVQAFCGEGKALSAPAVLNTDTSFHTAFAQIRRLVGSGAKFLEMRDSRYCVIDDAPSPPIESVAAVADRPSEKEAPLRPLYLRAPDAKPQVQPV